LDLQRASRAFAVDQFLPLVERYIAVVSGHLSSFVASVAATFQRRLRANRHAGCYLRTILGFIGLTDIEVVRIEGVAVGATGAEKALASAMVQSNRVLAKAA
jgi:FMN-dependent NADH-azoreductase